MNRPYQPQDNMSLWWLPAFDSLADMYQAVQRVMAGDAINEQQRHLLQPGVTMGGARPKSLMHMDGFDWVIKFSETGDELDTPLIEHASMQLARQCGIHVADTHSYLNFASQQLSLNRHSFRVMLSLPRNES